MSPVTKSLCYAVTEGSNKQVSSDPTIVSRAGAYILVVPMECNYVLIISDRDTFLLSLRIRVWFWDYTVSW